MSSFYYLMRCVKDSNGTTNCVNSDQTAHSRVILSWFICCMLGSICLNINVCSAQYLPIS